MQNVRQGRDEQQGQGMLIGRLAKPGRLYAGLYAGIATCTLARDDVLRGLVSSGNSLKEFSSISMYSHVEYFWYTMVINKLY
jgi:hypothetical protein